jgi:aspartyl-tRNA(Asn)/glutamyl-tRNA(Gln) amidotransferase subunit C
MLMAKLTVSDIEHISSLAKLPLRKSEIEKYRRQLSNILDHVSELAKVDTDGIEATSQTTGLSGVSRKDEVDSSRLLSQDEALSGKDNTQNGYFVVKRLIDN